MARSTGEWAALLGGTLSKMARVHGSDAPNAYLPEECYPVIEQTLAVALGEARAEGYAAALREQQRAAGRARRPVAASMLRLAMRAFQRGPDRAAAGGTQN